MQMIHGNVLDNDISSKLKMIELVKSLLTVKTYDSSYYDDDNHYAFIVSSKGLL